MLLIEKSAPEKKVVEPKELATSYLDHVRKTSFARALGVMVVAIGVLPNYVDFPVMSRWDGWAIVLVLVAFLVSGGLTSSGRVAWSFTIAAALAATAVLVFVPLPDDSGKPSAAADHNARKHRMPKPRGKELAGVVSRAVGLDPVATIFAFGRRWVLRSQGEVLAMNPDGSDLVSFSVNGPATAIIACAGALVISYANGYVGRFSPTTHRRLAHYHYGYGSGQIVCGGGYVWADKPGRGTIVQLDAHHLRLVLEVPVYEEASSIAYGMGAIWVADAERGRIVGVDVHNHQLLGPFAVMADADQIIADAGYLWVLHPQQSCLLRLDVHLGREVGPGIALGTLPSRMRLRDGAIFLTDYSDDTVIQVDTETLRTVGRPLQIPAAGRLTDIDERRGDLVLLDRGKGSLLTLDAAAQSLLQKASQVRTQRSQDCGGRS